MKPIGKRVINSILKTYSTRKAEFEPVEGVSGNVFRSRIIKRYYITIEPESQGQYQTGRIVVYHSDSTGKRKFTDIWVNDKDGLIWLCRNPSDVPVSDAEVIRDLQKEIERIRTAAVQSIKNTEPIIETKSAAGAGRPKETEKQKAIAEKIKQLLDKGLSDSEIMKELGLTRATYYRRKKQAIERMGTNDNI